MVIIVAVVGKRVQRVNENNGECRINEGKKTVILKEYPPDIYFRTP